MQKINNGQNFVQIKTASERLTNGEFSFWLKFVEKFFSLKFVRQRKGFTLIEILVVIGIIAVLALIVLVAINPARQFALSRNAQRQSNVEALLNAIGQNMADNKGIFVCTAGSGIQTIPTDSSSTIASCGASCGAGKVDLSCLVPTYIAALPFDPSAPNAKWDSTSSYDTEYTVQQTNGRVTVSAPYASLETVITNPPPAISVTR